MRRNSVVNPWVGIALEAWFLTLESATVIALRTAKVAAGGAGAAGETQLMIGEKIKAAGALQMLALTGGLGTNSPEMARKSIAHYRRKVGANRRRLQKN